MITYENKQFDAERALYGAKNALVSKCRFDGPADGESALKECEDISVSDCFFNLRYPLWHVGNAVIKNSEMTENCRAALWYDNNISIEKCVMNGIKALRECADISISESSISSPEFLWKCRSVKINNVSLISEYPLFECNDVTIDRLKMVGKYSFQYSENMNISNSELDTKDAFWHSRNVTVSDSVVKGEYLGWYSENLKFIRCRIIGTQPLCYCRGLVLEDCIMENTDLSFERSEVNAVVNGRIDGVKNPLSGIICADEIGELLIETAYANESHTEIKCGNIIKKEVI